MVKNNDFLTRFIFEKNFSLARHLIFWSVTYVFLTSLNSQETSLKEAFRTGLIYLPFNILYAYVIIYFFVPRFLIREKYFIFLIAYILWIIVGLLINFGVRYFILFPLRNTPADVQRLRSTPSEIFRLAGFMVMNTMAMFALPIKFLKQWMIKQKAADQFEKEKISVELELLKAQLHPHFLFNTLNNLYSLVNEKSDKAPKILLRLSGLLSYVLYECNVDEVLLSKEIEIIKDYVALEQERYGERLDISLNFSGDIENKMIVPMLFQPFIENSFKHGTAEQLGKVWMSIDLSVKKKQLYFKIINSCDSYNQINHEGIGIINVKKRLEMLYPGEFEMQNGIEGNVYIVTLVIKLSGESLITSLSKRENLTLSHV